MEDINTKDKPKHAGGRPRIYTSELAIEVCKQLVEGKSLRKICKQENMPSIQTVMTWLWEETDYKEEFSLQYAKARKQQAETMVDRMLDISDDADNKGTNKARLQIDTRKWVASKLYPKVYGEKVAFDSDQPLIINVVRFADQGQLEQPKQLESAE